MGNVRNRTEEQSGSLQTGQSCYLAMAGLAQNHAHLQVLSSACRKVVSSINKGSANANQAKEKIVFLNTQKRVVMQFCSIHTAFFLPYAHFHT